MPFRNITTRLIRPESFISQIFYLVGGFLLFSVLIFYFYTDQPDPSTLAVTYLAANVALLGAAISSKRTGLLLVIIYLYFTVFLAFPALTQVNLSIFPFNSSYDDYQLSNGFFLLAIGQIAFLLGGLFYKLHNSKMVPIYTGAKHTMGFTFKFLVSLTIGMLILVTVVGPPSFATARFDRAGEGGYQGLEEQMILIARSFGLLGILISILLVRTHKGNNVKLTPGDYFLITICTLLAVWVNFPTALPRFQLLGICLAVVVLILNFRNRFVKLLFTVFAIVFALYAFPIVKDLRDGISLSKIFESDISGYLLTADFDSFKQVVDTWVYFSTADFRHGENFVGVALFWIPRSLWPQKPIHTGELVSQGLGYPYTNVSNPIVAEAFASSGLIGVIIVLGLIGYAIRAIEHNVNMGRYLDSKSLIYAVSVGYAIIVLRGALNAVAPMIMTAFVIATIYYLATRTKTKKSSSRVRMTKV